ncbi:hypothetical protein FRC06_006404 [Ceratobasidium sp. 370]|nr:hypothetical protein FRC06_006404 [Ceratobasidium sp. 370]
MLDLIQSISNLADDYDAAPMGSIIQTWYCAAVMRARTIADTPTTDDAVRQKSPIEWLIWHIAGILAFGAPFGYLKRINNVDRTIIRDGINTIRWRAFLKELCKEWTDSNLLFIYFEQAKSHGMGTARPLAVILSLPVSLMLWGMFWFVFSIASCAYDSGLPGISDKYLISTRVIVLSFLLVFLILGTSVVLFLYKLWASPSVIPIVGQATHKFPVSQGAVQVDVQPNIGQNVLPKNAADILPDYPGYMRPLTEESTQAFPQRSDTPATPPFHPVQRRRSAYMQPLTEESTRAFPQGSDTPATPPFHPVQRRRSAVGFDESHIVIQPPMTAGVGSPSIPLASRTNSDPERHLFDAPSNFGLSPPVISGYSLPNGLTTSTYPTLMEAPLLSAFTYPGTPSNGFFVDFDLRRLTPYATTTTPEFHLFQRGPQLTLMASTGQVALLLTAQNEGTWRSFLEDDLQYTALITDIRNTCEQYGVIESITVPRRAQYQVRAEAIGQACVKFTRPEDASRALRGFMDHPFERCLVSARLLTEEEELAWGVSRRTLHPDLPTVTEEGSVSEDAAPLGTLPTTGNVKDQGPTKTTASESNPPSAGEGISQPGASPLASPPDAGLGPSPGSGSGSGSGSVTFIGP